MSLEQYKDASRKELWDILQIQMQVLQAEAAKVAELENIIRGRDELIENAVANRIVELEKENASLDAQNKRVCSEIAELEKELDALKIPILQIVAKKLVLLHEPNVLTGMYRMQLRDGYWAVWEPIEALKEQVK